MNLCRILRAFSNEVSILDLGLYCRLHGRNLYFKAGSMFAFSIGPIVVKYFIKEVKIPVVEASHFRVGQPMFYLALLQDQVPFS